MAYDPFKHHRRSIRLPGYDYTQPGAYFVTVVTNNREWLFGNVSNGAMITNEIGSIIQSIWCVLPGRFPNIELDEFKVMPNHIHGIIRISETVGAGSSRPEPSDDVQLVARLSRPEPSDNVQSAAQSPRPEPAGDGVPVAGKTNPTSSRAGKPRPYVVDMSPEINVTHAPTLGQIVAFFKYQTTKPINQIRGTPGAPIWQRNYHEHIIRDMEELSRIREYIHNNPMQWEMDDENRPPRP